VLGKIIGIDENQVLLKIEIDLSKYASIIGNHVVLLTAKGETLIAPVTDLWVQQNARLEAMMKLYNQKFNKQ
jgi:hypothetical protein